MAFIPLTNTEERLMWIDEQHGVSVGALGWRNGPHVRSLGFDSARNFAWLEPALAEDELVVQGVAVERVDEPRFKMRDEARLRLQVAGEIIVESFGDGVRQFLAFRTGAVVFGLG